MSLFDGINKFASKVDSQASNKINTIVEDYFIKHVKLSPSQASTPEAYWSKGILINSWYPKIGSTPDSTVGGYSDEHGTASIARIQEMLSQKPFYGRDNIVTLSNNLSYAYRADRVGWPRGLDSATGWNWTGNVGPYMMTSLAKQYIMRWK